MTDPLSIAASVLGVASAGAKLSLTLYEFATNLGSARKDVQRTAADLGTFAQVDLFSRDLQLPSD